MTIGIISTRYARALYSLALEQGIEDSVYLEMKSIHRQFRTFPEIKQYIASPIITKAEKIELLKTCAGGEDISKATKEFISFIIKREKESLLQYMCIAYKRVYRNAKNILSVKLVSACKLESSAVERICSRVEEIYNGKAELECVIDEGIIGGFIVTVNNNRLDSSILGELKSLKKSLIKTN